MFSYGRFCFSKTCWVIQEIRKRKAWRTIYHEEIWLGKLQTVDVREVTHVSLQEHILTYFVYITLSMFACRKRGP